MNRQTFYYHFHDILELTEWICEEDAERALKENRTYDTWQEGFLSIFDMIKKDKASLDVRNQNYEEIKKIADRDEKKVAAEKAKDQMDSCTTSVITPIMGVAEGEHKYGADAFEEFMANQGDKDKGKAPVDVAPVKKDEKRR